MEQGLFGAPKVQVIVGEHRHASVDRAVRFLGIGSENVTVVPADADGVSFAALEAGLTNADGPTIVVLSAADLNIGAFDSFSTLIPLAKSHGAWVHVDGAFGLFARASRSQRKHVEGIELADSWATDGHKWLNVPFDCGMFFVRDSEAHFAAMGVTASYIEAENQARDQINWNPEWSRRARGVAVYAALRELGRDGVEQLIDRTCTHARNIVLRLSALSNVEALWTPHLNQGLIRFLSPKENATDADHDARTDQVIAAISLEGTAFFSGTTWCEKRAMRVEFNNGGPSDLEIGDMNLDGQPDLIFALLEPQDTPLTTVKVLTFAGDGLELVTSQQIPDAYARDLAIADFDSDGDPDILVGTSGILLLENRLLGDLDGNNEVGFTDFLILSNNFGREASPTEGDLDGNGSVSFADFLLFSAEFGNTRVV